MLSLSGRLYVEENKINHNKKEKVVNDKHIVPSYKIEIMREYAAKYGFEDVAEFVIYHLHELSENVQEWNIDMCIKDLVENHRLLVTGYHENWR